MESLLSFSLLSLSLATQKSQITICPTNDTLGPETKHDPTERNMPRTLKSLNLVLFPLNRCFCPFSTPVPTSALLKGQCIRKISNCQLAWQQSSISKNPDQHLTGSFLHPVRNAAHVWDWKARGSSEESLLHISFHWQDWERLNDRQSWHSMSPLLHFPLGCPPIYVSF